VKLVVVGGGIAAITAARSMSAAAPEAQIEIISDEPYPYYLRPRLIQLLAGRLTVEEMFVYPPEWYAQQGIEVHLATSVAALDISERRVLLQDGGQSSYDRLLLAVGGSPFEPPLPGMGQDGVFTLRTIEDTLAIKRHAAHCMSAGSREAVVIGGGLLGLECANALTSLGLKVTVLQREPWLLDKQIDQEGSTVLQEQIERLGIRFVTNAVLEAILTNGAVSGVLLQDGLELPTSLVLCAAGVRPNTDLPNGAGLEVNRGVLVDEELRTSEEDVYAAGDVAEYDGQLPCIIPAAVAQARVAAANMVEPGSAIYRGTVPSTTLKVVGLDLTSIGVIASQGEGYVEIRHVDHRGGIYRKLVLHDGHIAGAILLGDKERVPAVTTLIRQGTDVSGYRDQLLENDFDFKTIIN